MSTTKQTTPSGIVTTETNERVIPATRRADGTLRKERRVRQGFVPQEDIKRYKSKFIAEREPIEPISPAAEPPKTKAQKKNAKRNAKKKEGVKVSEEDKEFETLATKEYDEIDQKIDNLQSKLANVSISSGEKQNCLDLTVITLEQLEASAKKIKALEKKLRQIEKIKEKEARGELLLDEEKEKMNKLTQINEELIKLKGIDNSI